MFKFLITAAAVIAGGYVLARDPQIRAKFAPRTDHIVGVSREVEPVKAAPAQAAAPSVQEPSYPMGEIAANYGAAATGAERNGATLSGPISSLGYRDDNYFVHIDGITGKFPRSVSYAQVTFRLYDADGSVVDTAMANVAGVGAGEEWRFSAVALGTHSAVRYRLENFTAY